MAIFIVLCLGVDFFAVSTLCMVSYFKLRRLSDYLLEK